VAATVVVKVQVYVETVPTVDTNTEVHVGGVPPVIVHVVVPVGAAAFAGAVIVAVKTTFLLGSTAVGAVAETAITGVALLTVVVDDDAVITGEDWL
jgi:hypothetical protein